MDESRKNHIKSTLEKYRNNSAVEAMRRGDDSDLTDMGSCVKYAYELLDALDTPNVKAYRCRVKNAPNSPKTLSRHSVRRIVRPLVCGIVGGLAGGFFAHLMFQIFGL